VAQIYSMRVPATQPAITRIQGAIAQNRIPANRIKARARLFGESILIASPLSAIPGENHDHTRGQRKAEPTLQSLGYNPRVPLRFTL
jgi:hypothetical protein